ncbi:MAG TPA: hypothetical protein DCL38_01335 [Lachnospiraceae bacterium]|nr:hypothetical protein [Lachnospiraceae bacterium]
MADEELMEQDSGKKKKDKKDKKSKAGFDATVSDDGTTMYTDAEEDEGGSFSVVLIVFFIILIWLAILALLIKLDVGGFGSNVLYPLLKDVPVINKILPDTEFTSADIEPEQEFKSLDDAVREIESLRRENEDLKKTISAASNDEQIAALKEEVKRLQTFEDSQVQFQKLKTEFYEEVVFSDEAPDIEEYKKFYESVDPENAEYLYKQVVAQLEEDKEIADYVKTYSEMKPKSAAAIFEQMGDRLDLVVKILERMEAATRAKILNAMNPEFASRITKLMDPE